MFWTIYLQLPMTIADRADFLSAWADAKTINIKMVKNIQQDLLYYQIIFQIETQSKCLTLTVYGNLNSYLRNHPFNI